jgi:cyclic-di-AMP phosphodiesterase PgpH
VFFSNTWLGCSTFLYSGKKPVFKRSNGSLLEPFRESSFVRGVLFATSASIIAELLFSHFLQPGGSLAFIGRVTALSITLYVIYQFCLTVLTKDIRCLRDLVCLTVLIVGFLLIFWFGRILGLSLSEYAGKFDHLHGVSPEAIYYAIPYAAGGLVLQAVLGLYYGLVFALSLATIVAFYVPAHIVLAPEILVTTLVACLGLSRVRSRLAFIRAGFHISLLSLAFALTSIVIVGDLSTPEIILRLGSALLGGVLSALLSAGLTPVVEYLGGYVTDMRLIEMATLDHPLLKELSIQAPGTWNHSMVMGMMAEAAADAVGANTVLSRVGCYFHDIGKMKKPLYFVENQMSGDNRHDKLSPSMSALIIRSHVKDGIELAKKHKLPILMEDMIAQHHGTSLIEYFYDKALKEADGEEVDKSLYVYPGPRPQTREAGILMLADGIEAASRSMSEPSADRIQGMVQKMINKVFASGQLNECELTLKDLHLIAKCFTRVLTAIHHQRISYSEPVEKGVKSSDSKESTTKDNAKDESKKDMGVNGRRKGNSSSGEHKGAEGSSEEDLKRLGLET